MIHCSKSWPFIYIFNRIFRAIGSVTVNLAALAQRQVLNLEEPLVDEKKMVTNVSDFRESYS